MKKCNDQHEMSVSGKTILGQSVWLKCHAHRPVLINTDYSLFIIHCALFLFVLLFFFQTMGRIYKICRLCVCVWYIFLFLCHRWYLKKPWSNLYNTWNTGLPCSRLLSDSMFWCTYKNTMVFVFVYFGYAVYIMIL